LRALSKKGYKQGNNLNQLLLGKDAEIISNKVTDKQYCAFKTATRRLTAIIR
jgi:hypothetical protein